MKKLLARLGLAASLLMGILSIGAAAPAQAAVTCVPITPSTEFKSFPFNDSSLNCTGDPVAGGKVFNALIHLQNHAADAYTKYFPVHPVPGGVQFYLFNNPADYKSYFVAHGLIYFPIDTKAVGWTPFSGVNYSLVFKTATNGKVNDQIASTAAHEAGHWPGWRSLGVGYG